MRPSEAAAALAADDRLGVLIDRRRLDGDRGVPGDLRVVAGIDIGDALAGIRAALVAAADGGELPRRAPGGPPGQVRLMDRFYLPDVPEGAVVAPMFDMIADRYDALTDRALNLATASHLLAAALDGTGPGATVLDFGCGTGVAAEALAALGIPARLLGVDLSAAMLARAAAGGLATMPMDAWRENPPPVDGAIASFVLHYGISAADLALVASSLRPGGAFAANLFSADPETLAHVSGVLSDGGLTLEARRLLPGATKPNPLLVFRKAR